MIALVEKEIGPATINPSMILLRLNTRIHPQFLFWYLLGEHMFNILNSQDDAVWLLNNIVSNQNNNLIPIAENGKIIKDNNGYWNPDNWGKTVEIDSNDITMKGVNQPLLGISDEGDVQYMEPNKDYKFKGKKVREFPIARNGINNLDENSLQQLDQLTNFTNYNKLSNGGWLDKF